MMSKSEERRIAELSSGDRKISDLKAYRNNPRKMSKEDFDLLSSSLKEFGDLSGIVRNNTSGELVGGNQRTNFFRDSSKDAKVVITHKMETPTETGTVALGYVLYNGEQYSYREVAWDADREARANILANKVGGTWDFDTLANAFDVDMLLQTGWKASELGFALGDEKDENPLANSAETYLQGNVKQIVLYFSSEEFETVVPRLDAIMSKTGATSHTEAFLRLLDHYENT